jgi:hypothetical protein
MLDFSKATLEELELQGADADSRRGAAILFELQKRNVVAAIRSAEASEKAADAAKRAADAGEANARFVKWSLGIIAGVGVVQAVATVFAG